MSTAAWITEYRSLSAAASFFEKYASSSAVFCASRQRPSEVWS
jgi:hypothetical protein